MAINRGISVDGQLIPNANGTLYSLPTGVTRAVITEISSSANAATAGVELYNVPDGGSPTTANRIDFKTFALDEGFAWPLAVGKSIETGGTLQGNDGGNGGTGVNLMLTVTEFTGDS